MLQVRFVGQEGDGKAVVGPHFLQVVEGVHGVVEGLLVCDGVHNQATVSPLHLLRGEVRVSLLVNRQHSVVVILK